MSTHPTLTDAEIREIVATPDVKIVNLRVVGLSLGLKSNGSKQALADRILAALPSVEAPKVERTHRPVKLEVVRSDDGAVRRTSWASHENAHKYAQLGLDAGEFTSAQIFFLGEWVAIPRP